MIDKCAEETRIVEINEGKIVKFTSWQDQKTPLIGSIFNARIIKKLNSGLIRAVLDDKKIVTVKTRSKSLKINEKIKIIITSEEFEDKPLQAKLWAKKYNFEKLNDAQRIINLYFNKNIPVIEDNFAIYWHNLNLDKYLLDALQPMVKIEEGGILWIEKTKAATLIDIDTKDLHINNDEEMLQFCKKAFIRCAKEIKLRNIGGMILVDFPRLSYNRKKKLHKFISENGIITFSESNFLGFSRLQLYEIYIPRNLRPIESLYENKDDYDFQNYLRLFCRISLEKKSKNNIQFLCGKNLYKKLKKKKIPHFINIVERSDLAQNYGELSEK